MALTNPHLTIRYGTVDDEYAMRLASRSAEDGPVWMINLMKYREVADYADGRGTTLSGREADDTYAPFESLAAVGAEIVLVADVDTQITPPTTDPDHQLRGISPQWDRVAVVKYPSGQAFIEMQMRADFQEKHVHKDAGMEQTIVIGGRAKDCPDLPEDAPGWSDVEHPPTVDDGPVIVVHVLKYEDGARPEMVSYQQAAGEIAVPHGVRVAAWFDAEGTIIGDGRSWDEVRFNAFPSKAAFMAVAMDPDRLAAQADHRDRAIADTYTMILRPVIDALRDSIG